jgi:hypothetical protein
MYGEIRRPQESLLNGLRCDIHDAHAEKVIDVDYIDIFARAVTSDQLVCRNNFATDSGIEMSIRTRIFFNIQ